MKSRQGQTLSAVTLAIFSMLAAQDSISGSAPSCNSTLSASLVQNLSFGDYDGSNGGTIRVDTAGIRTVIAGTVALAGGTVSAATYFISNSASNCNNRRIYITVPAGITVSNGGTSMTVNNFSTSAAGNQFRLRDTNTITIGADLVTNAAQAAGSYNGNFVVDFSY
jgi:hypothetical protein